MHQVKRFEKGSRVWDASHLLPQAGREERRALGLSTHHRCKAMHLQIQFKQLKPPAQPHKLASDWGSKNALRCQSHLMAFLVSLTGGGASALRTCVHNTHTKERGSNFWLSGKAPSAGNTFSPQVGLAHGLHLQARTLPYALFLWPWAVPALLLHQPSTLLCGSMHPIALQGH